MKKRVLSMFICSLLALSLTACSSASDKKSDTSAKTQESAKTEEKKEALKELSYDTIKDYPVTDASEFETIASVHDAQNDGVTRIRAYNGDSEVVVIPSEINGKKVIELGSLAFANNTKIKGIVVPDTVEYIDNSCFTNSQNLKYVVLSKNLKNIQESFVNTSIDYIKLPASLQTFEYRDAIGLFGTIVIEKGMKPKFADLIKQYGKNLKDKVKVVEE